MYAVVAIANTRCAAVILGADQNTSSHPTYNGCRTKRYIPGVRKPGALYARFRRYAHTWLSPNKSKWSIKNVAASTISQPIANTAFNTIRLAPLSTFQIVPPIGSHFQNNTINATLENSTYVLRSTGTGTTRVHTALNHCRAITLCCTANSPSSAALTASASPNGICAPESMDFSTPKFPRNPIAYKNVARNAT